MHLRLRTLAAVFACAFILAPAALADTRADFLKLLDRPRVPLAASAAEPVPHENDLVRIDFAFDAEAGQRVPGLLVKPAQPSDHAPARRPAVIVLHGTGGTKESDLHFMRTLARAGFAAVSIDGRHHGARSQAGKGSAEYVDAVLRAFRDPAGKANPFFLDTAWDVMRLVDYLETRADIDPRRIGCFGISKGGIETYLAAAADPRIAVAVPCIGVQSFGWAIDHDAWQSRISTVQSAFNAAAKDSDMEKPGADFVRTFYSRVARGIDGPFDAPAMLPLIAPRPLLAINGDSDDRTPMGGLLLCAEAARNAYRAAGAEERFVLHLQPKTGHKVLPESFVLAREWFVRWLKP